MELESGPDKDGQMKRARFTEEQIIGILREQEAAAKTASMPYLAGFAGSRKPVARARNVRKSPVPDIRRPPPLTRTFFP